MANTAKRLVAVRALVTTLALCAACSSVPPTIVVTAPPLTPTETSRFSTHTGPLIRATLPSTWTETPTPSATLTPTPTPVTPTATATAIPDLATLCDNFTVQYQYADDHSFGWNDTLVMFLGTPLSEVYDPVTEQTISLTVRFLATQVDTGENFGVQLASGQVFGMELPIHLLPGPGAYTWKVAVYGNEVERCAREGTFVVTRTADDLLTATSRAATEAAITPEAAATEAVTEDGTIIPIFQGQIPGVGG